MRRVVPIVAALLVSALAPLASTTPAAAPTVTVTLAPGVVPGPVDGRLLLLLSTDASAEPRFQIEPGPKTQQIFGIDVDGWRPGEPRTIDADVLGYPRGSLRDVPPGEYRVQALLHKYETFRRADGHVVKLPMDRGEGQQWNRAPGNVFSTPATMRVASTGAGLRVTLDQVIPAIADPPTTKYVRHERIQSERLTTFWGRPMFLGAHVLVPEGFDEHPNARYPLVINHGHFPQTIDGFRETPPDPDVKCEYSERFHLDCYNRIQQEQAHQLFKDWTGPGFPRVLVVEIQHANPYYDDSYAVNSANLGPYGDAIVHELIPFLEKKYRGLGTGWSRFMYGGFDRRLGGDGGAGVLPGHLQWRLRRVSRSDRLPSLHGRRHLPGPQRLRHRGAVGACAAARPAQLPGTRRHHAGVDEPDGAGARHQGPLGRPVGHLGGGLLAGRRRRLSEAAMGQAHRRDRPVGRRVPGSSTTTCPPSCAASGTGVSAASSKARSTSTSATWTTTT